MPCDWSFCISTWKSYCTNITFLPFICLQKKKKKNPFVRGYFRMAIDRGTSFMLFSFFYRWLNLLNKYWHTVYHSLLKIWPLLWCSAWLPIEASSLNLANGLPEGKVHPFLFVNTTNSSYGRFVFGKAAFLHYFLLVLRQENKHKTSEPEVCTYNTSRGAEVRQEFILVGKWSWTHKRYIKLIKWYKCQTVGFSDHSRHLVVDLV